MAKISAHGARPHVSASFSKPEDQPQLTADGLTHLTLTVTTDGRVLRKISHRFRSTQPKCGYRLTSTAYTLVTQTRVHPTRMADKATLGESLTAIAARWGYAPERTP